MSDGPILGVWAHPDDEAWLSSGIMMQGVAYGKRVVCVTATYGEHGTNDPETFPPEKLAAVRREEMAACLELLGVSEHHWLGCPDGGCAAVDEQLAIARVADIMQEVQPQTVLTFGPDGMTGHDDHKTVSHWTTEAFKRVAPSDAQLFYATNTQEFIDVFDEVGRQMGVMMTDEPMPVSPIEEIALYHVVEGEYLNKKEKALLAQASQIAELYQAIDHETFLEILREETFRVGALGPGSASR